MTPLSEACWDADIEAALLALTRAAVKDREYWSSTVACVEYGIDPETNRKIAISGLRAWVRRCKTEPTTTKQEASANADKTRRVSPQGGRIPHT